mmetsp:Transcript_3039/g.5078  ORF Transcript_3039/g.5078 Transcript_3039/m.5078 type:complete len:196 (+) Transcript_3039:76-663(+)|eukprot:CAMPEP_0169368880 /NCGR_PEP_ID=MMETSP1017-20121227/34488_1 /TAXON_ID=342587 /ORGANISM="Karlodinium micrum, Strain CCMP2283" /LENGTH=195 /DNA_ID=CAMNT_0009467117 /DNA_START=61 /DNA_END=648 /DNA_ORIENTATION=-
MAKAEDLAKFIDANDDNFTGFCCIQVLDQDGYQRKTKGSMVEAPVFLTKRDGLVILEAQFPSDPLFYLQIDDREGLHIFGQWWLGPGGWARTNQICSMLPITTQAIAKQIEQSGDGSFVAEAEVPFLKNAPSRLAKVSFVTKEARFQTKVLRAAIEMPVDSWTEMKEYRSRLWQSWKAWGGKDENEKKKKSTDKD